VEISEADFEEEDDDDTDEDDGPIDIRDLVHGQFDQRSGQADVDSDTPAKKRQRQT